MRYPKISTKLKSSNVSIKLAGLEQLKARFQKRHVEHYKSYEYQDISPQYYENTYAGNNLRIMGSSPDDFRSTLAVMSTLEDFQPNVIILGERNKFDLERIKSKFIFDLIPRLYPGNENLFAKTEFSKFFSKDFKDNLDFFKTPEENLIYRADVSKKAIYSDDYLTAAYLSTLSLDTGLLFGKPDPTLFFEDIVLRYSVEELQDIFEKNVERLIEKRVHQETFPLTENEILYKNLRQITIEFEKNSILQKNLIYQASILKKSVKSYKRAYLLTNNCFPKDIEELIYEPSLPDHTKIFRTYLEPDQAPAKEKVVYELFQNDPDIVKIKEITEKSEKKFNFENEKKLYEGIKKSNANDILEKYVILNHLVDNRERMYLMNGQNPFTNTIYKSVFSEYENSELYERFMKINRKYSLRLHEIQNLIIKKLGTYNQKILGRKDLFSYEDSMEKLKKREENFKYRFKICIIQELKKSFLTSRSLFMQVLINLSERIKQGHNEMDNMLSLSKYLSGACSKYDVDVFNRLMLEANDQIQLVKFPKTYKIYEDHLKELNTNLFTSLKELSLEDLMNKFDEMNIKEENTSLFFKNQDGETYKAKIEKLNAKKDGKPTSDLFDYLDEQTKKIYTVTFSDDGQGLPFDQKQMEDLDLEALGGEVITEFDVKMYQDGMVDHSDMDEQKREKIQKVMEMINSSKNSQIKDVDEFPDDSSNQK